MQCGEHFRIDSSMIEGRCIFSYLLVHRNTGQASQEYVKEYERKRRTFDCAAGSDAIHRFGCESASTSDEPDEESTNPHKLRQDPTAGTPRTEPYDIIYEPEHVTNLKAQASPQ